MIGRFIYGLASGIINPVGIRYIEETVPAHLYDTLAPTYVFCINLGTFSSFLIGAILPKDDNIEAMKQTELWKVILVYVPISLYVLALLGLLTIVRHDSIKFLVSNDNSKESDAALRKMYK